MVATPSAGVQGGETPFWIGRDLPGTLSPDGPRHDNDSEDIAQIRILPTTAEILSSRPEYLPVYDSRQWHLNGFLGLVDRHFRLFREDKVAGLRAPVRAQLEGGQQRNLGLTPGSRDALNTNVYNVTSVTLVSSDRDGFGLQLAIPQPPSLSRNSTDASREKWWVDTKKLDWNRLVCLVGKNHAMFCQVSQATCRKADLLSKEKKRRGGFKYNRNRTMFNSREFAYLTLSPVDLKPSDIDFMAAVDKATTDLVLLEFPSAILATFKPILVSLQRLSTRNPQKLPLSEHLLGSPDPAGDHQHNDPYHMIPPPAYTVRTSGEVFRFNLKVLLNDQTNMRYSPLSSPDQHVLNLCRKSILDEGQATALINCLRRRLALIQGPPGTGKSFTGEAIIEVLLANKEQARLGPIICVCQTNHALDQLLEHLYLRKGIHGMIRLGSESKSPTISDRELPTVMKGMTMPVYVRNVMKLRAKAAKDISKALQQLDQPGGMSACSMSDVQRLAEKHNQLVKQCDGAWSRFRAQVLREVDIIGVTTTGLSTYRSALCQLGSKVVICEEAGEVLEAHLLAALMPSVEHLILIGDHQQLRPQINNWDFQMRSPGGRIHAADLSLYERLVQPLITGEKKVPFDTLTIQRRMHPTIANLVRGIAYPNLRDADNVTKYPELAGFKRRLFWLHHESRESNASRNRSSDFSLTNSHEIDTVKGVVDRLVRCGAYADGEIAVITPYAAQLRALRTSLGQTYRVEMNERDTEEQSQHDMSANPGGHGHQKLLRVATVDNFQGEEASVVIVSLVRSNASGNCGFLSESNRTNVLLSRAKHSMILIGNSNTYSSNETWREVIQMLRTDGNIGTSFEVPCPRHVDGTALLSFAGDFSSNPSCKMKCGKRLSCGHICTGECHSDTVHKGFRCTACFGVVAGTRALKPTGPLVTHGRIPTSAPTPPTTPCGRMLARPARTTTVLEAQPETSCVPTPPLTELQDDDTSPIVAWCDLTFQQPGLEDTLTTFVSSSHSQLATLELELLDEQAALKPGNKGSVDFVRRVGSLEWLIIRGDGFNMIKRVHSWIGSRYDRLCALSKRVYEQREQIQQEEERVRATLISLERVGRKTRNDYDVITRLQLQANLSVRLLLVRCQVTIVVDCIEIRHHSPFEGRAVMLLDLTWLIEECEGIIQAAQAAHYPRLEMEAQTLAALMISLNVYIEFAGPNGPGKWESKDQYHKQGYEHVEKALGGVMTHASLSYLLEDLQAAEDLLRGQQFRNTVGIAERRAFWIGNSGEFTKSNPWYLCVNYHPFSSSDGVQHGKGPFCAVCGAPPRGQEPGGQRKPNRFLLD
jgi:hypothetical protein